MADRYISEKALIENIAKIEDLRTLSTKTIGEAISKTPTADVVEMETKHGYWKKRTVYPMGYNCSECNNSETHKSPFCRLCGTQMDSTPKENER